MLKHVSIHVIIYLWMLTLMRRFLNVIPFIDTSYIRVNCIMFADN